MKDEKSYFYNFQVVFIVLDDAAFICWSKSTTSAYLHASEQLSSLNFSFFVTYLSSWIRGQKREDQKNTVTK